MALFIPVAVGYIIKSRLNILQRIGSFLVLGLLFTGLVFSYSRAAWVSLAGASVVYLLILFKVPWKTVLLGITGLVAAILIFGKTVLMNMEGNDQDSSDNLMEHVQSISNITTDASNLERLNRWSCALRMFAKKPFFGFGPGTYMFQYAPFQKESQKTIISTNAADGGNAHSEYLGPLSESGIFGGLVVLLIVVYGFITGVRVYKNQRDKELKMIAVAVMIGLTTYFLHGIMNNFLDTDIASAGVWGFLAVLVALDVKIGEKAG
jgi:O-antigen ligase